jgi:microcystin-dependent protein
MPLYTWSQTANSNSNADPTINYAEGQAPSTLNDSGRSMMAALAKYSADISGAITTGGSSTAYTVTSNSLFDTLAHLANQMIAFVPHTTNTTTAGSQVTLNVDGLGAKPIRTQPSVEIPDGTLVQGTPYITTYNNSDGAFYLQCFGTNPYQLPLGALIPFTGSTAPNSSFVLPFGQAISRTTFATYFTQVSTTFGSGNGSTTFNVIDMRGRVCFGLDNMGGGSAGRITNAGSGIVGTTIGASGGAQSVVIAAGNLPTLAVNYNQTTAATGGGVTVVSNITNAGVVNDPAAVNPAGATSPNTNKMPPAIIVPYILRVL